MEELTIWDTASKMQDTKPLACCGLKLGTMKFGAAFIVWT